MNAKPMKLMKVKAVLYLGGHATMPIIPIASTSGWGRRKLNVRYARIRGIQLKLRNSDDCAMIFVRIEFLNGFRVF